MKTAIVYIHVVTPNKDYDPRLEQESGSYDTCAERFIETYKQFPAGTDHELVVVFTNGLPPRPEIYAGLDCRFLFYKGDAWCTGVHQYACGYLDADFALFSSARTYFWKEGWLKRLVEVREKHGDGMYATMSSNEGQPHLRTNFYGIDPKVLRDFEHRILNRGDTWTFESRDFNISRRYVNQGKPAMLVTWNGEYSFPDWRKPQNIFRRGDQSELLVWDRHTEIFAAASEEDKKKLSNLSDAT